MSAVSSSVTPRSNASRITSTDVSSSRSDSWYAQLMPMQPRPIAPTFGPAAPSVLEFMSCLPSGLRGRSTALRTPWSLRQVVVTELRTHGRGQRAQRRRDDVAGARRLDHLVDGEPLRGRAQRGLGVVAGQQI